MSLTLVIGNKNYSSWSLRPWLYLKHHGIAYEEVRIPLYREDSRARIDGYSPSGKVPALIDGSLKIWDSLAILEYLAERYPETLGWPHNRHQRAEARSIAAEMHSGFLALRTHCGMNCRRPPATKELPAGVLKDIARIEEIWLECRKRHANDGPWLFGEFSIADAMYAPVALRFDSYRLSGDAQANAYVNTVLQHPAVIEWTTAGQEEAESIPEFDH
jgi:glutathione S-transferase